MIKLPIGHDRNLIPEKELRQIQAGLHSSGMDPSDVAVLDACVSYVVLNAPRVRVGRVVRIVAR
jgi:hypothetical protein